MRQQPTLARIVFMFTLFGPAGCLGGRSSSDLATMTRPPAQAVVPIQRPPSSVQAVVPAAGAEMECSVEEPSLGVGKPWVLYRGARLETGSLLYRVDVLPVPGKPDQSIVSVMAEPVASNVLSTHETVSKPSELAFRIATLALAGPTR